MLRRDFFLFDGYWELKLHLQIINLNKNKMKRKIILIVVFISMNYLNVFAQLLPNTTWAVYEPSSTLFAYFHFGNDTLFRSFDNITYTHISRYWESGSNFKIFDIPPSSCSSDTGKYTFVMHPDTLDFTLVTDPCATGRSNVIASWYWVNLLATGMPLLNQSTNINIYPNPFTSTTTISFSEEQRNTSIKVMDVTGREIRSFDKLRMTPGGSVTLDMSEYAKGIYFVRIEDEKRNVVMRKLVKQ
jgi:hypothetical protein